MSNSLYQKYCETGFDENGVLNRFVPKCPDDFNFSYDIVDEMARLYPDKRAMVWCNDTGEERVFTFREMMEQSNRAANLFAAHGIQKGDRVMLILKRHYQFWFSIVALHKLGAIVIPATHLLTSKDIVYRCKMADIKAIICTADGEVAEHVTDAAEQIGGVEVLMMAKGSRGSWIDFDAELEKQSPELARIPNKSTDPMIIFFSSGTTGQPKMVLHDYSYPIGHIITASFWHNISDDDLHLTVADTGWGKAVWGKLYGQWMAGAAVFTYDFDKFVPKDLLEKIAKYKITSFCAPPTIYRFIIKEEMDYDLSSLRYATTAGEALNPEVYSKFYELTGLRLMEGFGQTETTLTLLNLAGTEPKPGSMGKPSPLFNIDLVDEDDEPVPPGQVGEIVVKLGGERQIGMFGEYYREPDRTAEVWHDGYYHTGDTAWRDEDGFFWYVGRTDDVIKASGYRIGPFEIESVLMEHPSVMECAVTGVPDPVRGQVVKATVVLTRAYQPSDALVKELQDYVKKQTAPYKYPRIIEFVEELPKTISGKIRRVDIREKDKAN